jgi:DNA-binding FrmR family transcriptional regulator
MVERVEWLEETDMHTNRVPDDARRAVINRLRRAEGQLRAVARNLEDGGDCAEVARQLTAAKSAVEHAGIKLLAAGLAECLADAREGDLTRAEFERLLMQVA